MGRGTANAHDLLGGCVRARLCRCAGMQGGLESRRSVRWPAGGWAAVVLVAWGSRQISARSPTLCCAVLCCAVHCRHQARGHSGF